MGRRASSLRRRTTPPNSTPRPRIVLIWYRWHPLYGKQGVWYGEREIQGKRHVVCRLSCGALFPVPDWMVDEAFCASHCLGEPTVSVAALREVRRVLSALGQPAVCDAHGIPFAQEDSRGSQADTSDAATPSAFGNAGCAATGIDSQRGRFRRRDPAMSGRTEAAQNPGNARTGKGS